MAAAGLSPSSPSPMCTISRHGSRRPWPSTTARTSANRWSTRSALRARSFGALVMEPICLGAGGMVFVDPLFQAVLVEVVRSSEDLFAPEGHSGPRLKPGDWRGLPVIYDEGRSRMHLP